MPCSFSYTCMNDRLVALAANDFLRDAENRTSGRRADIANRSSRPGRQSSMKKSLVSACMYVTPQREPLRAADRHDRAAGQRRAHRVFAVAPAERDLVPDRRQAIHFQDADRTPASRGRSRCAPGSRPRRCCRPGAASRRAAPAFRPTAAWRFEFRGAARSRCRPNTDETVRAAARRRRRVGSAPAAAVRFPARRS